MSAVRVSDHVVRFLEDHGVTDVFLVSGGGIMYLLDSLGSSRSLRYFCNRHEQACAISAEGYARMTNRPGVCLVTTGPGAVNAASGILGAWADSLPLLVISGQVKRELMADFACLRQKGPQEGNVLDMVAPVTKYASSVTSSADVRLELDRAWRAATSGRPGPAWVEIPLDIQGEMIRPDQLRGLEPHPGDTRDLSRLLAATTARAAAALRAAQRPLVLAGSGVRLGGARAAFSNFVEKYGLPVILPDSGKDLLAEEHPLNAGVFGPAAQRRANFAVQNCDCLLVLGAGLCAKKIGFAYGDFARKAVKIVVDIDADQLKHQVVQPDISLCGDVGDVLDLLTSELAARPPQPQRGWLDACADWRARYPLVAAHHRERREFVDGYVFMDALAGSMRNSDVLVTGNGLESVCYVQAFRVQEGQRTLLNANWGAMGWDLPLAIGACVGGGQRRTVCVTGDGSIQMNLQELQTISRYGLPIKVFVFNNAGYATIRATQRNLFEGRLVASDPGTGVDNPDFAQLAGAFGLDYSRLATDDGLDEALDAELSRPGPSLCEVMVSPDQEIEPRTVASRLADGTLVSRPLEDMTPLLPRDELWRNMHRFDDEAETR